MGNSIRNEAKNRLHSHPEIEKGEVFIGNKCMDSCKRLPYVKMRIGKVALDGHGNPVNKPNDVQENMLFPVFVDEKEYNLKKQKR